MRLTAVYIKGLTSRKFSRYSDRTLVEQPLSSDLSERLNLSRDEGEKWVVNLIRETRMGSDAKIDLGKVRRLRICLCHLLAKFILQNVIEINRPPQPIYQTVIEKTRGLAFRTQALGAAMARTQGVTSEQPAAVEAAR